MINSKTRYCNKYLYKVQKPGKFEYDWYLSSEKILYYKYVFVAKTTYSLGNRIYLDNENYILLSDIKFYNKQ